MQVSIGEGRPQCLMEKGKRKLKKFSRKPLDKIKKLCYNTNTNKGKTHTERKKIMNNYNFGKMNADSMLKVAQYFSANGAGCPSTASDIGVSGSFMSSLVTRGYAKVVSHKIDFIPAYDDLYRKVEINVYVLNVTASDLWRNYTNCIEKECDYRKSQAENYVAAAKSKLTEVEALLGKINSVRI